MNPTHLISSRFVSSNFVSCRFVLGTMDSNCVIPIWSFNDTTPIDATTTAIAHNTNFSCSLSPVCLCVCVLLSFYLKLMSMRLGGSEFVIYMLCSIHHRTVI